MATIIQSYNALGDPIFLEDESGHWCQYYTNAKVFESKAEAYNFINSCKVNYIKESGYNLVNV